MSRKGVAPKCRTCGNHPKSQAHRAACGAPATAKTQTTQSNAGRVAATRLNTTKRIRRVAASPVDPKVLVEDWVLGQTCLTCQTTYTQTPFPAFQEPDAKLGKYDVTRQLPNTHPDYPICEVCLGGHWKTEASRWGMKKEVEEVYASTRLVA